MSRYGTNKYDSEAGLGTAVNNVTTHESPKNTQIAPTKDRYGNYYTEKIDDASARWTDVKTVMESTENLIAAMTAAMEDADISDADKAFFVSSQSTLMHIIHRRLADLNKYLYQLDAEVDKFAAGTYAAPAAPRYPSGQNAVWH